jgi:caa(3)-type oxidase subunit IV
MTDHAHAAEHPAAPHRNYVKIWAILTALLVVSVTGPLIGIRVITLIAAFGVALVKAYLVAKNFMHLDIEKPIVHWALGIALVFMVLLYAGVAPDVQKTTGEHWTKTPGFHYVSKQAAGVEEPASGHQTGDKAGSGTTHGSDASGK